MFLLTNTLSSRNGLSAILYSQLDYSLEEGSGKKGWNGGYMVSIAVLVARIATGVGVNCRLLLPPEVGVNRNVLICVKKAGEVET